MSQDDLNAYEVANGAARALGLGDAEVQYALAVARGEGHYGTGWAHPNARTIELSKPRGLTGYEGAGSNNWGAEQGAGDAGSFLHVDVHADGTPYVAAYRKYSTPAAGFGGFCRILFGGGLRKQKGRDALIAALQTGSIRAAVHEQRANGYFELREDLYAAAVAKNYAALTAAIGWVPLLRE